MKHEVASFGSGVRPDPPDAYPVEKKSRRVRLLIAYSIIGHMLIRLLGEVSAGEDAGSLRPPRGRVATSVLAVLALARGRLVTTESLIDDLWDNPPDTARNAIQVAVSGLRKQFGPALVDGSRVGYRLRTDLVRIDWIEVEQYLATARDRINTSDLSGAEADASAARNLFAGSELAGADSSSVRASRGLAAQLRRTASVMWAQSLVGLGRRDEAIAVLAEEASLSILDEPVHVLLMSVLREQGRSSEALEIFEALRHRLDDQLGVSPSTDTVDEFHRLLDSGLDIDAEVADFKTASRPTVALPSAATPLLGRSAEVEGLLELMRSGHALVTLLGPGGIGKTRLGIAAARAFAELDERPAIFLDLTLSRSDADTRRLLADLLGSELDGIVGALEDSRMVVVVDNAEHLLDETAALATELVAVRDVRVLVTSRSPLELTQEHRFELDGLATGDLLSPAVQLLVNRAGLTPAEAEADVSELQLLVKRCEGIPLVIELLGSAMRWRSPAELLFSLEAELPTIGDRSRNRVDRHASVRAAIDWSVDQLDGDARRALGVLATIRGTFSFETAVGMIGSIGVSEPEGALASLVDASLVKRVREPGAIRFRILEPIRLIAEVIEEANGELNLAVHADIYFGSLVAAHERLAESTTYFDNLLDAEGPNLALAATTRWRQNPDRAVGEIAQLMYGWYRRDRTTEVDRWSTEILASSVGTPTDRARVGIAQMLCLESSDGLDNPRSLIRFNQLNEVARAVSDDLDDEWHRRWLSANHGRWVQEREYDRASYYTEQIRPSTPLAQFWVHYLNSNVARSRGRWLDAIAECELALLGLDPAKQGGRVNQTHSDLGFLRTIVGDFDLAERNLRETLEYAESHNLGYDRMNAQVNLAFLAARTGRLRECLGFVLAALDWSGDSVASTEVILYASMALHASGDDASAHELASLVATSYLGAAEGRSRLVDKVYWKPFWESLLADLAEVVPNPAGGWETSVARDIVAGALTRLSVDS